MFTFSRQNVSLFHFSSNDALNYNRINFGFISRLFLFGLVMSNAAFADGVAVDKVYHPYVLPNEREIEWRMLTQRENGVSNDLTQRFAYGQSIADNLMLEFYFVGERDIDGDFSLSAYEVEARWMITEQGQYWADWGMLFEVEKERQDNNWEVTSGIIMEKEFGRNSLTLNAFLIYEWGETINDER